MQTTISRLQMTDMEPAQLKCFVIKLKYILFHVLIKRPNDLVKYFKETFAFICIILFFFKYVRIGNIRHVVMYLKTIIICSRCIVAEVVESKYVEI